MKAMFDTRDTCRPTVIQMKILKYNSFVAQGTRHKTAVTGV